MRNSADDGGRIERAELRDRYSAEFMAALKELATRARHINVMRYIAGYLRERCDADWRRELAEVIEEYRGETVPLVDPLTLIRHWVRRFDVTYLKGQTYLEPHPGELMLRNHV